MSQLYIILNNFYASVEAELNPALAQREFVVSNGSTVIGMSAGFTSGQEVNEVKPGVTEVFAREKIPGLTVVKGHIDRYQDRSRRIAEEFSETAFSVAEIKPGEFILDVTRCPVEKLTEAGLEEVIASIIPCKNFRAGQAENTFIGETAAHTAGRNRIKRIPAGNEAEFMGSLPADKMPFLQGKSSALQELGVITLGDLIRIPKPVLKQLFGSEINRILRFASGRPFANDHLSKSQKPSRLWRFIRFQKNGEHPLKEIISSVTSLTMEMFNSDLKAGGILLGVKYADGVNISKKLKLAPTRDEVELAQASEFLFAALWKRRTRLSSVKIELSVIPDNRQISIFDNTRKDKVAVSVDSLRRAYGMDAIRYALSMR